jgi:hypothetical protein
LIGLPRRALKRLAGQGAANPGCRIARPTFATFIL